MDRTEEVLARFAAEFWDLNQISAQRRREQGRLLRRLVEASGHELDEITGSDAATFIAAEIQRGLTPNTAVKNLSMIRGFAAWAGAAGILDQPTTLQLTSVGNPRGARASKPKPYTMLQIKEFRAAVAAKYPVLPLYGRGSRQLDLFMRGRHTVLRRHLWRHARRLQFEAQIALGLELGLRRTEIYHLTIPALHPDNDEVIVLTAKQGPGIEVKRAVPYTAHARLCVQEWLDFRELLRPSHEQPWLSLQYVFGFEAQIAPLVETTMAKSLSRSFGAQWQWHRLRHTAATEWLRAGVPLEKVRLGLGHAHISTTLIYTEILDSDVTRAYNTAESEFARRLGLIVEPEPEPEPEPDDEEEAA